MKRLVVVAVALVVLGACGGGGSKGGSPAARVMEIEMRDVKYVPASIDVTSGEAVEIRFHNAGKVPHDAFIGDAKAQAGHESMMNDEHMQHGGSAGNAVSVEPGKTESLRYTFNKDDDGLLIGCHEPGHYAAGMKLTVNVSPA